LKKSNKVFYAVIGEAKDFHEKLAQELDELSVVNVESAEGYASGDLVAFRQFDEKEVKCEGCVTFEES